MNESRQLLSKRLQAVEERLQRACARSGRARVAVTLVAVTKLIAPDLAALLPELGVLDLGESRPQELWKKKMHLADSVRWHLVGHLQRNKIERTLPLTHLIHSVDSLRLLQALESEAVRQDRHVRVLLEVNTSGESQKHGFSPGDIPGVLAQLQDLERVHVHGLMTMAALADDPEASRPTFAALRHLRDRHRGACRPPHELRELSMGMTNDFEVAIEEGATMVRIGTALFEGLPA
jgi:PLP dependent protein